MTSVNPVSWLTTKNEKITKENNNNTANNKIKIDRYDSSENVNPVVTVRLARRLAALWFRSQSVGELRSTQLCLSSQPEQVYIPRKYFGGASYSQFPFWFKELKMTWHLF